MDSSRDKRLFCSSVDKTPNFLLAYAGFEYSETSIIWQGFGGGGGHRIIYEGSPRLATERAALVLVCLSWMGKLVRTRGTVSESEESEKERSTVGRLVHVTITHFKKAPDTSHKKGSTTTIGRKNQHLDIKSKRNKNKKEINKKYIFINKNKRRRSSRTAPTSERSSGVDHQIFCTHILYTSL